MAEGRFLDALPQLVAALVLEGASVEAWSDLACFLAAAGQQRLARRAAIAPGSSREERPLLSQAWFTLGCEIEEKSDFPTAAAAFLAALLLAEEADDRISYAGRAADVLAKAGDPQGAYRLLLLLEREVRGAEDPDSLAVWAMSFLALHHGLGGKEEPSILRAIRHKLPPDLKDLPVPGRLPGVEGVERALGFFARGAAELEPDEVVLHHGLLLSTAMLKAGEGAWSEAADCLAEAEALEAGMSSEDPGLDRSILQARLLTHSGQPAEASALFAVIWRCIRQRFTPERRLEVAGYYLEALGRWATVKTIPTAYQLAGMVIELYEEALLRQPGSAARRRIRVTYQRTFEGALLALVTLAKVAGSDSELGQSLLFRAWNTLLKCRNPELQVVPTPPEEEQARHLRELEDSLHRTMCHEVASGSFPSNTWEGLLEEVTTYEISTLKRERGRSVEAPTPSGHGVAVGFFQFRHLIPSGPLLTLISHQGRLRIHLAPYPADAVLAPLIEWASKICRNPFHETCLRDSGQKGFITTPASARLEMAAVLGRRQAAEALLPWDLPGFSERAEAVSWYLFPDGKLHTLPIELFLTPSGDRLGQRLTLRFCLRPSVPAACEERIDFSRGWLGVGGAPALATAFEHLEDTDSEVAYLQRTLTALGHPAEALRGQEAHVDRLAERLAARPPSVLHLAVHGQASSKYPDACFLVLAPAPRAADTELLPFRRIRDLPLAGVQLVVLSACWGLVGPSDESAGIEGLAWAFLQAGAAQVIASRYKVGDAETFKLMQILYCHLVDHPVAEALRRMREQGTREGYRDREIVAWAVWS